MQDGGGDATFSSAASATTSLPPSVQVALRLRGERKNSGRPRGLRGASARESAAKNAALGSGLHLSWTAKEAEEEEEEEEEVDRNTTMRVSISSEGRSSSILSSVSISPAGDAASALVAECEAEMERMRTAHAEEMKALNMEVEKRLAAARTRAVEAESKVIAAEQSSAVFMKELELIRSERAKEASKAAAKSDETKTNISSLKKQLSDVEQKYRAAGQEIEETKGNLTRIVAEHKRQVEDLERLVSGGKSELEECKKEMKKTKADAAFQLADKDAELEDLQSELKASKEKAEEHLQAQLKRGERRLSKRASHGTNNRQSLVSVDPIFLLGEHRTTSPIHIISSRLVRKLHGRLILILCESCSSGKYQL